MNEQSKMENTEDVMARFNEVLQKIGQDKECMEEIKNRNLWQKMFSNNTRDLAQIQISQNSLISELYSVIQSVLKLISHNKADQAQIWSAMEKISTQQTEIVRDFSSKIIQIFQQTETHRKNIQKLSTDIETNTDRIAIAEQTKKFRLAVNEICHNKNINENEQLCRICEAIAKYFTNTKVSNDTKRELLYALNQNCDTSQRFSIVKLKSIHVRLAAAFQAFLAPAQCHDGTYHQFLTSATWPDQRKDVSMSELINGLLDEVVAPEAVRYAMFRDELLELLDGFLNQNLEVDHSYLEDLKETRTRLKESQFEITLVGEFQGGKSTTFNMLCGGREISPRGLNGGGIKTSATVITAQHIEGDEKHGELTEWAEITWLDSAEIKRRIFDSLKRFEPQDPQHTYLADTYDNTGQDKLDKLFRHAWQQKLDTDTQDILRVATIQHKALTSKKLELIRSQTIVPLDQFQQLVTFPLNWEDIWQAKFDADFKPEQSAFAFIDRVLVRLHSPALERLGCRITDCPGLMVSLWDTERALAVMARSNAIWYLLNGQRQIGTGDLNALTRIKDAGLIEKCFFSINMRDCYNKIDTLLNADHACLKNQGISADHLYTYDAFLAYRMAQIEYCDGNNFTENDLTCLAEEIRKTRNLKEVLSELTNREAIFEAIRKLIRRHLAKIEADELEETIAHDFSKKSQEKLKTASRVGEITGAIEKMIITKKARSILVTEGVEKCCRTLEALKGNLKIQEDAATRTVAEAKERAEQATKRLNAFIQDWQEKFDFLNSDALDISFASDFFDETGGEIKSTISERAKIICKNEWKSWDHLDSNTVNRITTEKINAEFILLIKSQLNQYMETITSNPKFINEIRSKLEHRLESMNEKWNELQNQYDLFNGIDNNIDNIDCFRFDSFSSELTGKIETPSYLWEALKDIFTLWIRRLFQTPEDRIDNFFNTNKPVEKAYEAFCGNPDNKKQVAEFLGSVRRKHKADIESVFEKMKKQLETNISTENEQVSKANESKELVAKHAKQIREEIVEPVKTKIEIFKSAVCQIYPE